MSPPLRAGLGIAAAMASLFIGLARAHAGSCTPTLAIGQVVARPAGQTAIVEVTGTFGFNDLLQVEEFPLNLVIYQGRQFVRYPLGGTPQSGTFIPVQNGLEGRQIERLEASGHDEPEARLIRLEPHRLVVVLPPTIGDGTITALLYIVLPYLPYYEGYLQSNVGYERGNEVSTTLVGVVGGGP